MIEREVIRAGLEEIFSSSFHIDLPTSDTDMIDNGILDSFQFVDLVFQIEQRFGVQIEIDEIDLDDFRTLACIERFVSRRVQSARKRRPVAPSPSFPPAANRVLDSLKRG